MCEYNVYNIYIVNIELFFEILILEYGIMEI